ncbi:MAG: PHP domain-containing protein [Candidatus Omnitrophota bacterium]|nr:PHP domain-containing protein [Candidatus Omnitrophota bacterium]
MRKDKDRPFVDLHVHTIYSDGMFSPGEVVKRAVEMGLRAVAITDHDCVEGILPSIEAAKGTGLEIVPGVEISAAKGGSEIHILGYFIDWKDPFLVVIFRRMRENRVERMRSMVSLLCGQGIDIDIEEVLTSAPAGTVGRLHLARVMLESGVVRDLNEAFDRYIGNGKSCHVKHERLDYGKAIDIIRKAGGVPVLAHPGTMGNDEDIPDYVKAGLRGIEVYHSKHRPSVNDRYIKIANEYDLLKTGGSDCHGMGVGEVLLGRVKVGYEVVEKLKEEAEKIRGGKQRGQ